MRTARRPGLPRYLRRPAIAKAPVQLPLRVAPVLIRTVAFVPTWQRKRLH